MEIKDIITMITAITGCITGIASLSLSLLTRFEKPKYRIFVSKITPKLPSEIKIDDNGNICITDNVIEISAETNVENLMEQLNEKYSIYLQLETHIINLSKNTQLLLSSRYNRFIQGAGSSIHCEVNQNCITLPKALIPQTEISLILNYQIDLCELEEILKRIKVHESIGSIVLYLSSGTIERDINDLYDTAAPVTIETKIKLNKAKFRFKYK